MTKTSLLFTALIALAAVAGGVGSASAHGMSSGTHMSMSNGSGMNDGSGMPHHDFFRHREIPIIVSTSHPDCGYPFDKWQLTGSLFWKTKYFECKSGY